MHDHKHINIANEMQDSTNNLGHIKDYLYSLVIEFSLSDFLDITCNF